MIAVTFDVDDVAWSDDRACDEFATAVPAILDVLDSMPHVRTTWFVRVDAGIEHTRNSADALLVQHARTIERLIARGHEIAWHHHSVVRGTASTPSTDVEQTCGELRRLGPAMRAKGITSVRLGWAFSHADIIACLDGLGFTVDSTALPRPSYPWDTVPRDWEGTPNSPYNPSINDHRVAGTDVRTILEVPITVVPLRLRGDTQPDVLRYLNPAYHPALFRGAIALVPNEALIVTVTHPYETMPRATFSDPHPLLAFDIDALRTNLELLSAVGRKFVTVRELVN